MFDFLGDGIFNSDMDLWKNQRIAAQGFMRHHLFHQFLLRTTRDKVEMGLMPIIDHAAKHGLVINLEDIFQRFTFDSACILVTGYDPSCLSLGWRRLFNVDEVKNLVYLHGALCEALRLYPPVPFNHKEPVKPDMLPSGHPVHPKTKVLFSVFNGKIAMNSSLRDGLMREERSNMSHHTSSYLLVHGQGCVWGRKHHLFR
ncbi:hypothetical protein Goklo_017399 [Gossypium klotzschianum]|uniref:Cytochrome P450 n=1 Tax=Gossypium klotzschianum TaxID=34286 RepID=A0A7J8UHC6_9ROSI|nr:hypothetical protein [Gossypium klotzschianum]